MEMLLSVGEVKVKRLVLQWEQRMREWHSTTGFLSVCQTTKKHRRSLLTSLICHLARITPETQTMIGNVKWNFFLDMNWISTCSTRDSCLLTLFLLSLYFQLHMLLNLSESLIWKLLRLDLNLCVYVMSLMLWPSAAGQMGWKKLRLFIS